MRQRQANWLGCEEAAEPLSRPGSRLLASSLANSAALEFAWLASAAGGPGQLVRRRLGHDGSSGPTSQPFCSAVAAAIGESAEQPTPTQFQLEFGCEAVSLLAPCPAQLVEQHQQPHRDRDADQQLQTDLQHGSASRSKRLKVMPV
jgi:hypothetical protein